MEPITREEYYLAKIAGTYKGKTPEPVTIDEYYLATMAGDYSGNTPQPVTRLQYYMAKVAGVWGGSIPAPVTRLEYYWAAIASGEGKVFPPVTREEHFLVLVADAYSVVLTVVTGNPALLENSKGNRGLESLTLYGKSTQGSTPSPSPEYPQEIESVVDAGEISVEVCGKNLIAGRKFYGNYSNGIAYIIKLDGDVVFPYKPSYATYGICYAINALAGKKYTFSGYNLNDNASLRIAEYANLNDALDFANVIGYKFGGRADTFVTYTAKENGVIICLISGIWSSNNDLIHICTESELLQIELGSTATSYEPYKPAQKLIIPTPGGLPGIPVTSDGNYTDADGQQWVCDEIDLEKGERVQWIGKIVVDGKKVKFVASSNSVYWNLPRGTSPGIIDGGTCISRYFAERAFDGNKKYGFAWTSSERMKPYFDTSEELNAFCVQKNSEGNPLTIYYCIGTPIRTPLPPETIAAYKALRTYSPTTTVINDAGAGMSVGYAKMK